MAKQALNKHDDQDLAYSKFHTCIFHQAWQISRANMYSELLKVTVLFLSQTQTKAQIILTAESKFPQFLI